MVRQAHHAEHEGCPPQVGLGKQGYQRKKEGIEQSGIGPDGDCLSLHRGPAHHGSFWSNRDGHKEQTHQGRSSSCTCNKVIVKGCWNHRLTPSHSWASDHKAVKRREHFTPLGPKNQVLPCCRPTKKRFPPPLRGSFANMAT